MLIEILFLGQVKGLGVDHHNGKDPSQESHVCGPTRRSLLLYRGNLHAPGMELGFPVPPKALRILRESHGANPKTVSRNLPNASQTLRFIQAPIESLKWLARTAKASFCRAREGREVSLGVEQLRDPSACGSLL